MLVSGVLSLSSQFLLSYYNIFGHIIYHFSSSFVPACDFGHSESSASDYATLSVLEYIFIAVSCTEVLLKIFALGFTRYFQSHWNKIDCFLIVTSLLEVAIFSYLSGEWKPQIFRLLLGLRMIRLVRWFTKIERFAFATSLWLCPPFQKNVLWLNECYL
jgi:hypothetical protein